jgi:L-ascorbate metabolism protein UlaG (beta-lactamase superfamily)
MRCKTLLCATAVALAANVSAGEGAKKACSSLLKGVAHFQGDDIRMKTKDGKVIFVDPVVAPTDALVVKTGMVRPDVILITHPHEDHFRIDVIKQYLAANGKAVLVAPEDAAKKAQASGITNVKAVLPGQSYEVTGIQLQTVPAYFLEGNSHPKQNGWVGYVLQVNGRRYYVTGDTQMVPEIAPVQADVVFPLIFGCGGNIPNALKIADAVKATLAVPVHADGQEGAMKKYVAQLSKGIEGRYYWNGEVRSPE